MSAKALFLFLVIALLVACSSSSPPTLVASASIPGPVVPVGGPEIRDLGPTTETVWNCGSGGGTVVKHPTMSVVTNYAVEWQVGGTSGVGVRIGDGVIPGGVDLSATLEGHYATGFEQGVQQGTGWDLPAEPNIIMVYTLMWREKWQPGYVDVRLADQSVMRVNVRYRIGIQSEIVGKQQQTCGEEQQPPAQQVPQQPSTSSPAQPGGAEVSCAVNGRVPIPNVIQCNIGTLSVSITVIGATGYPSWDRAFNGLVSEIDVATGVKAADRIEKWGPPGEWDTLEAAGWLNLQGSNNMASEFTMFDEVSNSTIMIIPNDMSQALQFDFPSTTTRFTVATICENSNPCSGQVVEFTFVP